MPSPDSTDPSLAAAIAQFNQGDYYGCHDQLEALWMTADTFEKPFFQGILQIAVGFYHLGNHNWQGAAILLGEGVNRLRPFAPHYQEIDVALLINCGWTWLQALQQTGPEAVIPMAEALHQTLTLTPPSQSWHPSSLELTIDNIPLFLPLPRVATVSDCLSDHP